MAGTPSLRERLRRQTRRLAWLRCHLWLVSLPGLAAAVLAALVWSGTYVRLERADAALRREFTGAAAASATAYAQHLVRSIEQIDQYTRFIRYEWERSRDPVLIQQFAGPGLFPDAPRYTVFVTDRDGTPVTAALSDHKGIAAQADYFIYHRDNRDHGLRIGAPVLRRHNNRQVIYFTRRLDTADGGFDGVVQVAIDPAFLLAAYDGAAMGRYGFKALAGRDGVVRSATIGGTPLHEQAELARGAIPLAAPAGAPALERWFADGKPRFVARHPVGSYPFVALVGLAEEEMLAQYRETATLYRSVAWGATAVLLLAALAATLAIARALWNRRQREEERLTYRVATDGANEGFAIFRAVRDQGGTLRDFRVVDCNDRGAAYLGVARERAIGEHFSTFYGEGGSAYFQMVLDQLRHAMEVGFHEDEYRVPPESPVKAGWLNRRFVRSGDGLALTIRDITASKVHQTELARIANEDPLTSLPNRHALIRTLPMALARAHETQHMLALFFIDLDNFKNVNDTLGHAAGDALLTTVARRLKSVLRGSDFIARQGGDEFTVILEQVGSQADCAQVAEKMIAVLDAPLELFGTSNTVGASIGISMYPKDGMTADTLLKHADIAMYHAKFGGKGHFCFYQPSLSASLEVRINSERALQQALAADQFALVFQPRVHTATGELLSLEALVRWIHPERGLVPPLDFIPLAEETGLIVPLGELVLEKVCAQLARWKAQGLPVVPVSINVSPRQFADSDVTAAFAHAMARHDLDAGLIEIEVTESSMMGAQREVADALTEIRALGIKLLVDDFGTGYSSLSQLLRLEMDVLKVDRTFTAELGRSPEGAVFFKAIVSMAHALGMSVVAEGVETEHQLELLQHLDCDEVQGYLISRPLGPDLIPPLLEKRFLLSAKAPAQGVLALARA
jgi:diguanylate cyclase (GGDEF)-like protein